MALSSIAPSLLKIWPRDERVASWARPRFAPDQSHWGRRLDRGGWLREDPAGRTSRQQGADTLMSGAPKQRPLAGAIGEQLAAAEYVWIGLPRGWCV